MDGDFNLNFGFTPRRKNSSSDRSLDPAPSGRMGRKSSLSRPQRSYFPMDSESPPPSWEYLQVSDGPSASDNVSVSYRRPATLRLPPPTMPPAQPPRYSGDGLDFRRPVSLTRDRSGHGTPVIDLTDDSAPSSTTRPPARDMGGQPSQRPPRFAREIIDLEDESNTRTTSRPVSPPSPEVQFISMRNLTPAAPSVPVEDEIEITGSNTILSRPQIPPPFRSSSSASSRHMNPLMALVLGRYHAPSSRTHRTTQRTHGPPRIHQDSPRNSGFGPGTFFVPSMNYSMVGFDLQTGERPQPPPPPPTYDPPPPVPAGFTRSPDENHPVGCPNCENELCVGDTERQRQVWIIKACGHVYCGECASNRWMKASSKGKDPVDRTKHKAFKACVVEGCDKKTSNVKSMIQVFL